MSQLDLFAVHDNNKARGEWRGTQLTNWVDYFDANDLAHLDKILLQVKQERNRKDRMVYPLEADVLRIFDEINLEDIRCLIIGQDPYHDGNATGHAFACRKKISPSLKKIGQNMKLQVNEMPDLYEDWNITLKSKVDKRLEHLIEQGVFLFNTCLTVLEGLPKSHYHLEWQIFTKKVITIIMEQHSLENL